MYTEHFDLQLAAWQRKTAELWLLFFPSMFPAPLLVANMLQTAAGVGGIQRHVLRASEGSRTSPRLAAHTNILSKNQEGKATKEGT